MAEESHLHTTELWIALPPEASNCEPAFDHHPVLPRWHANGCDLTLLAGSYQGKQSPTKLYSPLVGIDLHSANGCEIELPLDPGFEYGMLCLQGGAARIDDKEQVAANELVYLAPGRNTLRLRLPPNGHALLLGGTPSPQEVLIWWNFVGYDKAVIAQAQRDWEAGHERYGRVVDADGPPMTAPPLPWVGY